jgi:hypothetical protein
MTKANMNLGKAEMVLKILIRLLSLLFLISSLFIKIECDTHDWYLYQVEVALINPFEIALWTFQVILITVIIKPDLFLWIRLIPIILFYLEAYLIRAGLCEDKHNAILLFCIIVLTAYLFSNIALSLVQHQNRHMGNRQV